MSTRENQDKVFESLAKNEVAVSHLYRAYAEKFPRYRDFWLDLANEEIEHSRWINKLFSQTEDSVHFDADRFDKHVYQVTLKHMEEKIDQAKNEKISFKDALSIALEIETGMLERGYFEVFEGVSTELKEILHNLAVETEEHTNRIRDRLAKKRRWFF